MGISVTPKEVETAGAMFIRVVEVEVTDYNADGESLTPTDLGMDRIQQITITPKGGDVFTHGYDFSNEVLHLDIAGGENVSMQMMVFGR